MAQDRQRVNALPKSAQPGAKKALAEIWDAEDKDHARAAASVFAADYGTKWPKAAAMEGAAFIRPAVLRRDAAA